MARNYKKYKCQICCRGLVHKLQGLMPDSYAAVSSSLKKRIGHDFPTARSLITNDETIFQKFER